jgi:hypothetical protein
MGCDMARWCVSCNAPTQSVKCATRKRIAWMWRNMLRGVYLPLENQGIIGATGSLGSSAERTNAAKRRDKSNNKRNRGHAAIMGYPKP